MCTRFLVLLMAGLMLAETNGLSPAASAPDEDAAEVVKLAHTLSQAFVKGDVETVNRLLADDQIAVLGYGVPESKAGQLEKLADLKFEKAMLQDVKAIRISQDVVAISFRLLRKGTFRGKELTPEARVIAVWAKRDGQWRQVTYQETRPETLGVSQTSDLANLSGTWLTVSLVNDGKTLVDENSPPKAGPATKLVYDGNMWLIKVGDKTVASGQFQIDATKTPKEIDIMDASGLKNEKTKLGIYELDGDTYKFCLAPAAKPRPTAFTSKAGTGHSLGVSKREKP